MFVIHLDSIGPRYGSIGVFSSCFRDFDRKKLHFFFFWSTFAVRGQVTGLLQRGLRPCEREPQAKRE